MQMATQNGSAPPPHHHHHHHHHPPLAPGPALSSATSRPAPAASLGRQRPGQVGRRRAAPGALDTVPQGKAGGNRGAQGRARPPPRPGPPRVQSPAAKHVELLRRVVPGVRPRGHLRVRPHRRSAPPLAYCIPVFAERLGAATPGVAMGASPRGGGPPPSPARGSHPPAGPRPTARAGNCRFGRSRALGSQPYKRAVKNRFAVGDPRGAPPPRPGPDGVVVLTAERHGRERDIERPPGLAQNHRHSVAPSNRLKTQGGHW